MKISSLIPVLLSFLLAVYPLFGQKFPEKGIPPLRNYPPEAYDRAGKVWAIQSAANGLVYFAADQGLLEYDGQHWHRYCGSKGFTRSLLIANDSLIYTGADKDFGVWRQQGLRGFSYQSLYPFRESAKGLNEEFWGVYQLDEGVVFVSFDNLYLQKGGPLTKVAAPTRFYHSFQVDSLLYLADEKEGLFQFDGLSLKRVFSYPDAQPWRIMGVDRTAEGLLIVTRDRGLYRYRAGRLAAVQPEISRYLQRDQVFCFAPVEDSHYAFGTILNGVYITDRQGQIIQHLNKQKGLLNNTILSLHYSPQGSLWLGMDFGLCALRLSSEVAYVLDHQGVFGTGQTALLQGEDFYLGTNQGLYYSRWENLKNNHSNLTSFALMPGTEGQVWTLQNLGGELWCGHDQGLFRLSAQGVQPVYTEEGVLSLAALDAQHLVAGTYNGLSLLRREGQRWTFEAKLAPVQGACSQVIAQGDSLLWVNIPKYGLIQATLSPDWRIERQRIYLAETLEGDNPWLTLDSLGLHLSSSRATYAYDAGQDSFLPVASPPPLPDIANRLPIAWNGLPLNQDFRFFPIYNGFALYSRVPRTSNLPATTLLIRSLTAFNNDSSMALTRNASVPYALNNLRVQYLVPHQEGSRYRYRLLNFQDEWSEWATPTQRDFLDLPAGRYELQIEAQTLTGILRSETLPLRIRPPWYRRWYSLLGLALLGFGLYYLQRVRNQRKMNRLKAQMEARERMALEKQAEAYQQEKMVQTQQKLEEEIADLKKRLRAKTIELAKKGKENEDKNRLLQTLKDKISAIENRSTDANRRWAEMNRLLDSTPANEDHTFEMQIDELNQEFLHRLKATYPTLTTYDLRLATYLKMGLSSREIAELLNVLPSSVNVSRSRLRKKLNLEAEQDLYEFLIEI